MKNWFRNIALAAFVMVSYQAVANTIPHDTIYFYESWEQMLLLEPKGMIVDPYIEVVTPYEIYFETGNDVLNDRLMENYVAASYGDSIWLISTEYLKKNFKGDNKRLSGFAPVYFNEKVAYITAPGPLSVKDILFGDDRDDVTVYNFNFYYIDFLNHRIARVTPDTLSKLLEDYHDLQMRYEGMKDYKKSEIIEDYFYKYIDRATQDYMRPYILDLVE